MVLKIIFTLFSLYKSIINTDNIKPNNKINGLTGCSMDNKEGYDYRHDNNTNIDQLLIIKKNYDKKKLLDKLENNNINEIEKMNILKEYSFLFNQTMAPNILEGGLLDDFNFNLVEEDHQA